MSSITLNPVYDRVTNSFSATADIFVDPVLNVITGLLENRFQYSARVDGIAVEGALLALPGELPAFSNVDEQGLHLLEIDAVNILGLGGTVSYDAYLHNFGASTTSMTIAGATADSIDLAYGGAANDAISLGAGDDLADGGAGNDALNGGAGADELIGGAGNDLYVIDNVGDFVNEGVAGSNGVDVIRSTVTVSLLNTAQVAGQVENVQLVGTASVNATGNTLANLIVGNSGNNAINGAGGADTMRGMGGNDLYIVDNVNDLVDESVAGSGGSDTVRSTISFNLGATSQVKGSIENVALMGTGNIDASGTSLANVLIGNSGNNVLKGGNGNDTLTGGGGNDTFFLNGSLNAATNVETITDMNQSGNDTIQLASYIFTGLATGALSADAFRIGTAAADADDRIIYNSANGQLFYDSNGDAANGSTLIAILDNVLPLTAADFLVV